MKRKKLVAIFAALMVALSTSIPVFAAENTKISSIIDQDIPSSYIEEVIQCNSDIDPTCPWTQDTQVKETIPTYDLDNNVSGYILNLSTNGNDTGYMVYDISSGEPVLAEFGYEGVYSIQGEEVTKKSELGQSKLIPVGMNEYVLQRGNDLYTLKTNTKITDKKDKIQNILEQKEANIAEYVQREQMASTLSTRAQEIFASVSIPNLWKSGYTPIMMKNYGDASCVAICNVNMLKYWHECRNIPSLYNSYDEPNLSQTVSRMRTQVNEELYYVEELKKSYYLASTQDGLDGIYKYCSTYACTSPKSSEISKKGAKFDWDEYIDQINNGNFVFIGAKEKHYEGKTTNVGHAFSGVGYQKTSTGNFLRVGDQWTNNYSHFFNTMYSSDIIRTFYCQW